MVWTGGAASARGLAPASTTTTTAPSAAKAEVLVDVATGRVLIGQNDHVPLPPASLTKILTAMIAADWLRPGTVVPVSAQAAAVYPNRVGMKAGQRWPLAIALRTLLVFSANDSAYALAQRVGGSLAGFAAIMRQAGAQLGLSGPMVLRDPAGLDGKEGFEGGNLLSAWDVAIVARDLMANPTLASIVGIKRYRFTGPDRIVYDLDNKNNYFLDSYPGAIGVKTGFTDSAGFSVAEEAVRGHRAMLAVVMNGENSYQTATDLLNRGFTIPVAAERKDPVLPPVREPERPARPAPPTRQFRLPVGETRVTADLAGTGTVAAPAARSSSLPAMVGVGAALVFAALAGTTVGYRHRRRHQTGPRS
jgi:D-alanyl-D-alanine carboxypeptidase